MSGFIILAFGLISGATLGIGYMALVSHRAYEKGYSDGQKH